MNIKKLNEELDKVLNEIKIDTIATAHKASQNKINNIEDEKKALQAKFDAEMQQLQTKQDKETERFNRFTAALEKRKQDGYYLEIFDEFDDAPLSPWYKRFLNKEEALNVFNNLSTEEEWIEYANNNEPDFPIENVMAVEYWEVHAGKRLNSNIKFFNDWFKNRWEKEVEGK